MYIIAYFYNFGYKNDHTNTKNEQWIKKTCAHIISKSVAFPKRVCANSSYYITK